MRVGAPTLPLLAAIVRDHRPGCAVRQYDEINYGSHGRLVDPGLSVAGAGVGASVGA